MKPITLTTLRAAKQAGQKFAVITAYDASFARLMEPAGIEVILVGDSLGMVLQGHDSTLPVTVDDMAYHTACVKRAGAGCLIVADMPFASYDSTEQALHNAAVLMRAGAHMVKLEGGAWLADTVQALTRRGIPVCGHIGLTPQSVNTLGGYRVQGRAPEQAQRLREDALVLEQAGAGLLVLECVPRQLGAEITQALGTTATIGIGAGPDTDGQVLVLHDMLGLSASVPRFVRDFMAGADSIQQALAHYAAAVKSGEFPDQTHCYQ